MPSTKKPNVKLLEVTKDGPYTGIGKPMYLSQYTELLDFGPRISAKSSYPQGFHMVVIPFSVARDEEPVDCPLALLRDHLIELGWTPPKREQVFVKE